MKIAQVMMTALGLMACAPWAHAADAEVPPFYEAAATLRADGPLGTVLAKEPVETAIPNAEAWRIAYVSSDVAGNKTIATGLLIAPKGAPPAEGRPILAWAHGTTGTAQNCGPSQVLDPAQDLNQYFMVGGTSWTDFGLPAATHFIAQGYVLVATDYQGLGGGGIHQYAMASTNGRDVINSVRAAGSLGLSGGAAKAAVYGWSQGGGATLAAGSLKDYIGETGTAFDGINFVGFVAMAPEEIAVLIPPGATEQAAATKMMGDISNTFGDSLFNFAHFVMAMWAMPSAFPELKFTDLFTEDAAPMLTEIISNKCIHVAGDTMAVAVGTNFKSVLKPQPENASAWVKALIKSSVDPVVPVAPVIIYYGTKDVTVPPALGALYQKQMCGMGANVTRVQLPGEQTHYTTPPTAQPMFVPWIEDRFAGKPVADGCSQ